MDCPIGTSMTTPRDFFLSSVLRISTSPILLAELPPSVALSGLQVLDGMLTFYLSYIHH